eukprot:362607-Chlamydomonas_euryale.AAC.14
MLAGAAVGLTAAVRPGLTGLTAAVRVTRGRQHGSGPDGGGQHRCKQHVVQGHHCCGQGAVVCCQPLKHDTSSPLELGAVFTLPPTAPAQRPPQQQLAISGSVWAQHIHRAMTQQP